MQTDMRTKLHALVRVRNRSEHSSNLQFQFDTESVGLKLSDLGQAYRYPSGGYRWFVKDGSYEHVLIEQDGKLRLDEKKAAPERTAQ